MKKQRVIRTYPDFCNETTNTLSDALRQGYIVVMANPFEHRDYYGNKWTGTEYIVEKEIE